MNWKTGKEFSEDTTALYREWSDNGRNSRFSSSAKMEQDFQKGSAKDT